VSNEEPLKFTQLTPKFKRKLKCKWKPLEELQKGVGPSNEQIKEIKAEWKKHKAELKQRGNKNVNTNGSRADREW